jgi:hypothetical protein
MPDDIEIDQSEDQPAGAAVIGPTVVVVPPADSGESDDSGELDRLRAENAELRERMTALEAAQMTAPEVSAVAADTAESVAADVVADATAVAEVPVQIADEVVEAIAPLDETVEGTAAEIADSVGDATALAEGASDDTAAALVEGETLPSGEPLKRHWSHGAWVFGDSDFHDPFARKLDA